MGKADHPTLYWQVPQTTRSWIFFSENQAISILTLVDNPFQD